MGQKNGLNMIRRQSCWGLQPATLINYFTCWVCNHCSSIFRPTKFGSVCHQNWPPAGEINCSCLTHLLAKICLDLAIKKTLSKPPFLSSVSLGQMNSFIKWTQATRTAPSLRARLTSSASCLANCERKSSLFTNRASPFCPPFFGGTGKMAKLLR